MRATDIGLNSINGWHTENVDVSSVGFRSNAGIGCIPPLRALCEALDVRLLNIQTSEFAEFFGDTAQSMHNFSGWQNRTILEINQNE